MASTTISTSISSAVNNNTSITATSTSTPPPFDTPQAISTYPTAPPNPVTCVSRNQTGTCIPTGLCADLKGISDPGNLCRGGNDIQCCTYGGCTSNHQAGLCIPTEACAGSRGISDPSHLCPGGNNIQCCTYGNCKNSQGQSGQCIPSNRCIMDANSPGEAGPWCPGQNFNIACCTYGDCTFRSTNQTGFCQPEVTCESRILDPDPDCPGNSNIKCCAPAPSPAASSISTSTSSSSSTNTGAIAGGVVGGVVAIGLLGLLFWYLRRRRNQIYESQAPTSTSKLEPGYSPSSMGGYANLAESQAAPQPVSQRTATLTTLGASSERTYGGKSGADDSTMVDPNSPQQRYGSVGASELSPQGDDVAREPATGTFGEGTIISPLTPQQYTGLQELPPQGDNIARSMDAKAAAAVHELPPQGDDIPKVPVEKSSDDLVEKSVDNGPFELSSKRDSSKI